MKKTCARVSLIALSFLLLLPAFAQDKPMRVGDIEFFGYKGLDLQKIRAAIPLHVGDQVLMAERREIRSRITEAVQKTLGRPATDVATVCCENGEITAYIGLPGQSSEKITYNPAPTGAVRLSANALGLYNSTDDALMHAIQNGRAGEDDSKGYALSVDPNLRAIELKMRVYALHNQPLLLRVLQSSSHAEDRQAAAEFLGYARQSQAQINALVRASRDAVRNNATRALGVLASSSANAANRIPASGFISMLNSGVWTDRNKSVWVVQGLTASRNPKLLAELRSRALPSLIEMAQWDAGHAYYARVILGRVAGIDEPRLQKLIQSGQINTIIAAAR